MFHIFLLTTQICHKYQWLLGELFVPHSGLMINYKTATMRHLCGFSLVYLLMPYWAPKYLHQSLKTQNWYQGPDQLFRTPSYCCKNPHSQYSRNKHLKAKPGCCVPFISTLSWKFSKSWKSHHLNITSLLCRLKKKCSFTWYKTYLGRFSLERKQLKRRAKIAQAKDSLIQKWKPE